MAASAIKKGRPSGDLWKCGFFAYEQEGDRTVCQLLTSKGEICGRRISKKITSNLEKHLSIFHKQDKGVLEYFSRKAERAKAKSSTAQTVLKPSTPSYSSADPHQKKFDYNLALLFGGTTVSYSVVESPLFIRLVHGIDPKLRIPGRLALAGRIDKVFLAMCENLRRDLSNLSRISISADIWSKPGLTESFLGICGVFFSRVSHQRRRVALALVKFDHPHTADRILYEVNMTLDRWGIPKNKVLRTITDNGSNMVKAFNLAIADASELVVLGQSIDEEAYMALNEHYFSGLEQELDEEAEFQENESAAAIVFENGGLRRIPCFAHTLDLIAKSVEKFPSYCESTKAIQTLYGKVQKKGTVKEEIKEAIGRLPRSISRTRWTYFYLVIKDLLSEDMFTKLTEICTKHNMVALEDEHYDILVQSRDILEPFAEISGIVSGEKYTTISRVIPRLLDLNDILENVKLSPDANWRASELADFLNQQLKHRFSYVYDSSSEKFDPIYVTATYLDPYFQWLLSVQQKTLAVDYLKPLLKQIGTSAGDEITVEFRTADSSSNVPENPDEPSCSKKSCELASRRQEYLKSLKSDDASVPNDSVQEKLDRELRIYKECLAQFALSDDDVKRDPIDSFWRKQQSLMPLLYAVATDILSCPASSALVERLFSMAGIACSGRRYRLSGASLEREVLIQQNWQNYCAKEV